MENPLDRSNDILDAVLNWQYPPFSEETGMDRVVAFGDHSHKCPVYVRQTPPCTGACPAGNEIRAWLTTVRQTELKGRSRQESCEMAWHTASKTTPFPASCGRICPFPCETACNRAKKEGQGVNIAAFERWIGDYGIAQGLEHKRLRAETMAHRVAVIGAGPAGLSCAFQLARRGYPVTVFEALAEPGGMLRYGIPAFRLPRAVLNAEIAAIAKMGVEILCNHAIGSGGELQEIRNRFDAVFVGVGAHQGIELDLKGSNVANVFSGVAFLRRINAGETVDIGDRVIVAGGGNTAITAARAARRLGAEVTIIYRRTRAEMPTLEREIEDSLLEGITMRYLVAPVGIRIDNGRAVAVQCAAMEPGEADERGRRTVAAIAGSDFELPCTALITAFGQRPETARLDLGMHTHGWLKPDATWSLGEGLYAGGDVMGLALVTTAIGHGRMAAEHIDANLMNRRLPGSGNQRIITHEALRLEYYPEIKRHEKRSVPIADRCAKGLDLEADLGITEEQFIAESERCMSCGLCFECRQCLIFCPQRAIEEFPQNPTGEVMYTHYTRCIGCHICSQACPCGYIKMGMSNEL
jgi:NADPH-dependent glutamate synthase beta subunit-like oxidoreductase/Pyruvate/2-oxoacid:ferredoxin oxidoreductase delta subunit